MFRVRSRVIWLLDMSSLGIDLGVDLGVSLMVGLAFGLRLLLCLAFGRIDRRLGIALVCADWVIRSRRLHSQFQVILRRTVDDRRRTHAPIAL